ncbi:TRAP transporter small permease [Marinobacter subterrani]|uniref:TRAP transporter small permease protein n=1 Tax=Marinobacter subterrani TaxID=1658765 RepID=A0A0J7JG75_9GAMM|nr:TRAP transporter small permease [Marinobacter subterrani]KMQ76934.1 TRAP-type C4-dicarboxylate transport system, small permease component [Marinobacter subterrani]
MTAFEVSTVNLPKQEKPEHHCSGFVKGLSDRLVRMMYLSGAAVVVTTLVTMFVAILLNVVLRYFFGGGLTWAYEIPAILFPWTVAGGMVMASAQGRHITVDLIPGLLSESFSRVLAGTVNLFVSAVSVGVVYYSMPIIKASQYSRLAETGIPQIYGYSSLVYAFSLIALIGLLSAIEYLIGNRALAQDPTAKNYS